jgi:hypothetical protein
MDRSRNPERCAGRRALLRRRHWQPALAVLLLAAACDLGTTPPVQEQAQAPPPPPPPVAPESAPPGTLPLPHKVAPPSVDELARKRAEWQEQQRMQEQARSELEAWQRSRRPTDGAPAVPHVGAVRRNETESDRLASAMRAWYGGYSARAAAVSLALSQYGMASTANASDQSRLLAACRDLRAASTALLADANALQAPLEDVSTSLRSAYAEIKATADSCLTYRQEEQAAHFAAARRAMAQAGAALRPYGMVP